MSFLRSVLAVAAVTPLLVLGCGGEEEQAPGPSPSPSPSPGATAVIGLPTPRADGEPQGKIAWVSFRDVDREIYVMNADGSGVTNLTNSPDSEEFDPDWSPDGKQIVFTSDREGRPWLHLMNADGSDQRPLTFGRVGDISPKWSPDGTRIAFSRGGTLMVMDASGSNEVTLFEPEGEATAAPCKAGAFLGGWSPDSRRITYYSASVTRGIGQVCIIDADGSNMEVVVSEPPTFHVEPAWSPDGEKIVYRRVVGDNNEVYVVDLNTREVTNLTNDPALDAEPAWSPDGEWIAFASIRESPNMDIFIMRKDGSDVRRLAPHPAKDSYPLWTR